MFNGNVVYRPIVYPKIKRKHKAAIRNFFLFIKIEKKNQLLNNK